MPYPHPPPLYSVPPPTYRPYDFAPSPHGPPPPAAPYYGQPRYAPVNVTPMRAPPRSGHTRRASHEPKTAFKYASPPPPPPYFQPPAFTYAPPPLYEMRYTAPKHTDYVSPRDQPQTKARRFAADSDGIKQQPPRATPSKKPAQHSSRPVYGDDDIDGYNISPQGSPPPPYHEDFQGSAHWNDAYHEFSQAKSREPHQAKSRPRAKTYDGEPQPPKDQPQPTPKSKKSQPKTPPQATAADAARAGIPAGYSYKNWDPTEEPIFLLGSVFDANSLGKWIYDWTVYTHGAATPMSDLAGDLWLLLIQLAGKVKRAEDCVSKVRRTADRDLIEDFLDSGDRLWARLKKILKACEEYMYKASRRRSGKPPATLGPKSGCEFVDTIFGRDRKLEETEKFMTGMRLWSMRFDANCEAILRNPAA